MSMQIDDSRETMGMAILTYRVIAQEVWKELAKHKPITREYVDRLRERFIFEMKQLTTEGTSYEGENALATTGIKIIVDYFENIVVE